MTTVTMPAAHEVGGLLRRWRQNRRLSQLDLSLSAEVSARHLSFIETGRSRPSRELLIHLARHLEVPKRECNALLLAAGYAPAYRETPLDDLEMEPIRDAVDKIVHSHEPFPALVVDRHWDIVASNDTAKSIMGEGVSPTLLEHPVNALRVSLHPDGLAPRIANLPEWSTHLLHRLDREIAVAGDGELKDLAAELRSYPGIQVIDNVSDVARRLFVPLELRTGRGLLRFFSTIATFGTALDITVAELAIEAFFPADAATAAVLTRG
jgi:transcriptional regulator with XRE-family HTH domain